MKSASFLMSPPDYFNVTYVINPWMQGHMGTINTTAAQHQWQRLYNTLTEYASITLLNPHPHTPDLVFTANAGLLWSNQCILSHFRHPERQKEEPINEHWFSAHGYELLDLPRGMFFEGAGDALFQPGRNTLWAAYGFRSDKNVKPFLGKACMTEVLQLRLVNASFYHLDTCFCPLYDDYVLYYPDAFDTDSHDLIKSRYPRHKRIIASMLDAQLFACNAVLVPSNDKNHRGHLIMNCATDRLKRRLLNCGFDVIEVDVSEFLKAGGGTKCLTLQL